MANNGEDAPLQARPGERLAVFRATTMPEGLLVRLIADVTAATPDPNRVERLVPEERVGPSPHELGISFGPDVVGQFVVRAFLWDPLPELAPGEYARLALDVEVDGEPLAAAGDAVDIYPGENDKTAFVLSVLDTRMLPPSPTGGEAG